MSDNREKIKQLVDAIVPEAKDKDLSPEEKKQRNQVIIVLHL